MRLNKRGQQGIGTLIIFIAMILVAAVAAGVLIQTSATLQNKALETGQDARGKVTTHLDVITISGTDAVYDSELNFFSEIFKLSSGSEPVRVDKLMITFDTAEFTSTLLYNMSVSDVDDYFSYGLSQPPAEDEIDNVTYVYLRNDLNNDGVQERIRVNPSCDGIQVDMRDGTVYDVSLASINLSDCSNSPNNCTFNHVFTNVSAGIIGQIDLIGTTQTDCTIDRNVEVRSSSDSSKVGLGFFTLEYLQKGPGWQNGYIQKGDVVEAKFASPQDIVEETKLRIGLIPSVGIITPVVVTTPEVMTQQRMYLYP